MNIDSSEEESDPKVQESCWTWKFPQFTPSTSTRFNRHNNTSQSQQQLIPQDNSGSTESLEHVFTAPTPSHNLNEQDVNDSAIASDKLNYGLRKRPRSVGDISDAQLIIENTTPQSPPTNNTVVLDATTDNVIQGQGRAASPGENSVISSSSSGGFLSFLGSKFHKSGTRHLERSSNVQSNSSDSSTGKHSNNRNSINDSRYTKFPVSSPISRSGSNNPATSPVQNPALPRSHTFVCDSGLATVLASSSTHTGPRHQLKPKSKSDHNLDSRINAKNLEKCSSGKSETKQKLNSVQLGDHATISLPWTPGQQRQNNLSSVTPTVRSIPNTHTNIDFSKSSVRYVDTDFWNNQTHHHWPLSSSRGSGANLSRRATSASNTKRRSRSLERTSNFRIIHAPVTSLNQQQQDPLRAQGHDITRRHLGASNSLERQTHSRVRQNLNPSEESVLLRHCSRTPSSRTNSEDSKQHRQHIVLSSSKSNEIKSNSVLHKNKPPLLRNLHTSSEPNSSFSSCDSSSVRLDHDHDVSSSAPPSPPPRPLCTLKPNKSRPVVSSFSFSAADKPPPVDRALKRKVPSFMTKSTSAMNSLSTNMTSSLSRRPIPSPAFSEPIPTTATTVPDSNSNSDSINSAHSQQEEATGLSVIAGPTAPTTMSTVEDARNSGFINKPTKGWLHSDQLLTKEGVQYTVRYVGCLDVNTSMKSLDFDTRSLIAKECINQICEAAGLKSIDRKRRTDRRLIRLLGLRPRLEHAGSDVHLTITSTCIKLTSLDTGAVIAVHEMPNISFASGGDSTMLDFVAYVAKDQVLGRACFVLECGSGLAQDVITTVGQAFELRFKEYLQKRPPIPISRAPNDDPEYYNDLPGKVPPDSSMKPQDSNDPKDKSKIKEPPKLTLPAGTEVSVNLIDFEAPTPPAFGPTVQGKGLESLLFDANSPTVLNAKDKQGAYGGTQNDPFDMQPFAASLNTAEVSITTEELRKQLEIEDWFHGIISRSDAEDFVTRDGDFLVRESQNSPGQFVLTGIQNGCPKHLLLVDQNGIVRTKDRTFDSVAHLIRHHCENSCPILSAESMVILRNPILKIKRAV